MDVSQVQRDLVAEQRSLDEVVAALDVPTWDLPTASPGWAVRDQIGHLAYFDSTAALAVTDPDEFSAGVADLLEALAADPAGGDEVTLGPVRSMSPADLLDHWRSNRSKLSAAAATLDNDTRVPWYGPSMGAKSFLTARLMECWAHGQDIVDAVGADRQPTDRLRHIAQLGFITRGWSYINRGLEVPEVDVGVELMAPSGDTWRFGPHDAPERVRGPAVDFCLVVTQRRAVRDTNLDATPLANDWLEKAQAFAGPPTTVS